MVKVAQKICREVKCNLNTALPTALTSDYDRMADIRTQISDFRFNPTTLRADIFSVEIHVRQVPLADICPQSCNFLFEAAEGCLAGTFSIPSTKL
jgi:hypothetical protein